jgi:myosin heavy subunit
MHCRPILIAMNPFKWLPIYGEEMVQQYHAKPYGALPPHCYQEAEDAFQQLQRSGGQNQSVVICGDSGAGKTETTKLMLQYISIVARDGQGQGADGSTTIGERLVQSNPLMEAFGNAKTLRNNNSRWVGFGFVRPSCVRILPSK